MQFPRAVNINSFLWSRLGAGKKLHLVVKFYVKQQLVTSNWTTVTSTWTTNNASFSHTPGCVDYLGIHSFVCVWFVHPCQALMPASLLLLSAATADAPLCRPVIDHTFVLLFHFRCFWRSHSKSCGQRRKHSTECSSRPVTPSDSGRVGDRGGKRAANAASDRAIVTPHTLASK